ncbi:MAG: hypothetical protein ACKOAD_02190, partial [Gammaproteobacteria bacterium]
VIINDIIISRFTFAIGVFKLAGNVLRTGTRKPLKGSNVSVNKNLIKGTNGMCKLQQLFTIFQNNLH